MPELRLITIPISHFCEKARWALERCAIPYREEPHLQLAHLLAARRAGGGRTVPVLVTPQGALADSRDILDYADAHAVPARRLFPAEPAAAAEIRALDADWDEHLGPATRLWIYDAIRGERRIALRYAPTGVPALERRALPIIFPVVSRVLDRYLKIEPASVAAARAAIDRAFDAVAERLADGRPFLMGEEFTAADITFSALAAAVLGPPEYGVPLPPPGELPPPAAAVVESFRAHPAGAFAMRMFREQRRSDTTRV